MIETKNTSISRGRIYGFFSLEKTNVFSLRWLRTIPRGMGGAYCLERAEKNGDGFFGRCFFFGCPEKNDWNKKQQVPVYGPLSLLYVFCCFFLLEGGVAHLFGLGDVMDYVIFGEVGLGGSNALNGRSFQGLTDKIDFQRLQKEVSWVLVMRIVVIVSRIKIILLGIRSHQQMLFFVNVVPLSSPGGSHFKLFWPVGSKRYYDNQGCIQTFLRCFFGSIYIYLYVYIYIQFVFFVCYPRPHVCSWFL